MKIKLTKIIAMCAISLCCIFLCGCASVNYGVMIYSNGVVRESIAVDLQSEVLQSKGYTTENVINEIKNVALQIVQPYINTFVGANLFRNKSSQTINNVYKTTINQQTIVNGVPYNQAVVIFAIANNGNKVEISIEFYSASIYYEFYEVTQEEIDAMDDNDVIEENFLFNKTITPGSTAFKDLTESSITTHFLNYFTESGTQNFNLDNVVFEHAYATYDSSLKSNCDYKFYEDGLTYHVWQLSSSNLNRKTEFYKIQIKPLFWYVIALALTFIFIIIMLFVSFVNKKRKPKIEILNVEKGLF